MKSILISNLRMAQLALSELNTLYFWAHQRVWLWREFFHSSYLLQIFGARQSSHPSCSPPAYRSQFSARIGKLAGKISGYAKIAEPASEVLSASRFEFNSLKNFVLLATVLLIAGLMTFSCTNNTASSDNDSTHPELPEITLDLSPSDGNPRNSEGDFVSLKDGRIMFVYSKYMGESSSDHAPASLAARYSSDGGKTWTSEDEIVVPNEGEMNVMSVSLLRLQNGDIALFYLRKNSTQDCIPMMRISKDEAKSWSEAIPCITDKEGYFVLNNDRVIQLRDGRLMLAVARHNEPGKEWKGSGDLFSYHSDDQGQSWISSDQVPNSSGIVTQEPGLIEMKDGKIMMFIRASGGFQQLSFSADRGETWSPIEASNIPSPVSPATIEQIPATGDWLLAWNNNDGTDPAIKDKRTPFTVAVSKDEGNTWEYIKNIEDDPDGWYCYIAMYFPDDENILLGYCAGNRPAGTSLSVTHVTRLTENWVYEK